MIKGRIEKNWHKLKSWSQQFNYQAFRLYDHDIPEFPFYVDKYADYLLIYDRRDGRDQGKNQIEPLMTALREVFPDSAEKILIKKRERQKGDSQYEKLDQSNHFFWVDEGTLKFRVNLHDYLDTGLFLDHRPLRQQTTKIEAGTNFLNLFCYTGSFSVAAAKAGAETVSVDMSGTYLDWAKENFKGNDLDPKKHLFIEENALEFLKTPRNYKFDRIFLDPPTFSNSKKMQGTFEVERDQGFLINSCIKFLKPEGVLIFSNNKERFKLDSIIAEKYNIRDISEKTIPKDFHRKKTHSVFEIRIK